MKKADKQGWLMICLSTLLFLSIGASLKIHAGSVDQLDQETMCRVDVDDPVLRVLIDKTDPWDEQGRQRLASLIRKLKMRLAPHERLSIHVLDEAGTYSPHPEFDRCNPGRGEQANILYQNPRRIEEQYEQSFGAPLDEVLETLLKPGEAPRSPIIETIRGLRDVSRAERLVVVSDMMQNSEEVSFYGKSAGPEQADEGMCRMESPYESVEVYYLNRGEIPVSRKQEVRQFWEGCLRQVAWQSSWQVL